MTTPPLALDVAQARLLALAVALPVERIDVSSALGRYLAEPLLAQRTQPAADLSAMDGYALAPGDLAGPWQIIGESAAGHPFAGAVASGQAVRIATGALLPTGADCVILQEDTERTDDKLTLTGTLPQRPDQHIRRQGNDFRHGVILLAAGTRIGPAQIALALSAGHNHLAVRRLPRLAILDSGDELVADAENCAPHQLPASNGAMLAALASSVPCVIKRFGPVPDQRDAWARALAQSGDADVIVTSGGVSVGDHDLVRPALEAWGADIDFWRVAIKPGKPLLVATRASQLILGLPGNPVSSHVTAHLFLLPLLRALLGAAQCLPRPVTTRLGSGLPAGGPRQEFLRGAWDGATVTMLGKQNSGALAALAASNVLIDRPALAPPAKLGSDVLIYPLEIGGIA